MFTIAICNFETKILSPTSKVGSIEDEGIWKGCIIRDLIKMATNNAINKVLIFSIIDFIKLFFFILK